MLLRNFYCDISLHSVMIQAEKMRLNYLRRASIIATILSFAPFVRMIALTGSLARGEATEKSDIDFFVVLKRGRLWSGRAFVSLFAHLTGLRRYEEKIAGRICLNCFQTEDHLLVGPKTLKNARDYANLIILYQRDQLARKFFQANQWIPAKGYRFQNSNITPRQLIIPILIRWLTEALYELLFSNWGEKQLRSFQIRRILNDPRTQMSSQGQIYISDQELRFHPPKGEIEST